MNIWQNGKNPRMNIQQLSYIHYQKSNRTVHKVQQCTMNIIMIRDQTGGTVTTTSCIDTSI